MAQRFSHLCRVCNIYLVRHRTTRSSATLSSRPWLSKKFAPITNQLYRHMSTSRLLGQVSKAEEDESLKEFSKELDIQEKPKKYKAWAPIDDVYIIAHYPPEQTTFQNAIEKLRTQAMWHIVPGREYKNKTIEMYIELDMNLGEKKTPAFSNLLVFPHHYWKTNKVLCFAEGEEATIAEECGADMIIGNDRFTEVGEEICVDDYDFCVTSRSMISNLTPIKRQLRHKFPNARTGTTGKNIGMIVQKHRYGKKYRVSEDSKIQNCIIGNFGLSDEQIEENLQWLIDDIQKHSPVPNGSFIKDVRISGYMLDNYIIDFKNYIQLEGEDASKVHEDTRTELEIIEDELKQLKAS